MSECCVLMIKIVFMRIVLSVLLLAFLVTGCKKKLDVKEDKYFEQVNWVDPGGERDPIAGTGPMHLELRKNGQAFLYPGSGDIVWDGTYKISGDKLKVTITGMNQSYKFSILSNEELKAESGELLHLKNR